MRGRRALEHARDAFDARGARRGIGGRGVAPGRAPGAAAVDYDGALDVRASRAEEKGHSQIRRATLAHLGRGAARDLPFGTRTPGEA